MTVDHEKIVAAYHDLAASASGQLVLADLEARFGWTSRSMFDPNDPNGLTLAWREGGRAVLAHIGRMIETPVLGEDRTYAET